jgi:transcriptional regulator with XRE-family HTH domain
MSHLVTLREEYKMSFNKGEFGKLVKSYRNQRGWTQEELADRWGYPRTYITQIERGQRKLDNVNQVMHLADILDIPQEKLEAIGRGIPQRKIKVVSTEESDSALLQMLLAPGKDMVQMAYMLWIADQQPILEEKLQELTINLDQAVSLYHGEFLKPAQRLLAYTHQMRGRVSLDRLDFAAASGHFSEMIDLGHEMSNYSGKLPG